MYPFIISKLTSVTVLLVGKAKNIDSKKAMIIAIPCGIGGGAVAAFFF